jgi:uncharacterized Zn finger protein
MPRFSRTWWGQKFIAALEEFTDPGRLGRGRAYAHNGRILSHQLDGGTVRGKVRGSINPYFGVYKEPTYTTTVTLKPIARADWTQVIADVSSKAGYVAKLLLNEMPDTIEDAFARQGVHLLPAGQRDFSTSCSCPDWGDPCKHVAGLCYLLASELDRDPFLLFELRGLSREQLHAELARSPLGRILSSELAPADVPVEPATSYFTRPTKVTASATASLKEFWTGAKRLPPPVEPATALAVPALLIKKQGDYPPFWTKDASFVEVMEEVYQRVRGKSPQLR